MDPKNIKLTTLQKIKPLLRAINEEIPWPIILFLVIGITVGIIGSGALEPLSSPITDFILRRVIGTFIIGIVTCIAMGFSMMIIETQLLPMIKNIKSHYDNEELKEKKRILDNIIDDEILKK
jgi:hypothetical protein